MYNFDGYQSTQSLFSLHKKLMKFEYRFLLEFITERKTLAPKIERLNTYRLSNYRHLVCSVSWSTADLGKQKFRRFDIMNVLLLSTVS